MRDVSLIAQLMILGMAAALLAGCGASDPYPPEVMETLEAAGENRGELEAVLAHYIDQGDSLKLEAAYFLIGNMQDHSYAIYALEDSSGTKIDFSVLDYPDYKSLQNSFDSLESEHGILDFERKDKIQDCQTITSDFLVTQIDYAFRARIERPWCAGLSFEDFCNYVLPYRGSNEPLEPWREFFFEKYAGIADSMSDAVAAAAVINDDVKSWFGFDPRFYYHPTDQGLSEMMTTGLGRCEDMTNVTIYAMRANGLAVTGDYTPHWANSGNNHAWNAIITLGGDVIPFMGAESNPGRYRLENRPAKVYRKMFASQPGNLVFLDRKQEKIPGWLAGKSCRDVTADYQEVCDVTITFEQDIPDSVDIAYLCVFNSGDWKAIHWARIRDRSATFTDMGREIAYIPALYLNEEIVPWGSPFILESDCTRKSLKPDTADRIEMRLAATTGRQLKESTDGVVKSYLTPGQSYELFYMADEWESLGTRQATDRPLAFENVPAAGLYWLVAEGSDKEERIFTVEDGRQIWW